MRAHELYCLMVAQKRTIRSMGWMLVLCVILIGASAFGNIQRERIIVS